MYSLTTNNITITVTPEYEDEQSLPADNYFIWEYHVHIRNLSGQTVQLLNRRWMIVDDKGRVQQVEGAGVVGLQPVMRHGESFEYTSSVHLTTPSGVMMGVYEMENTRDHALMNIEIPSFSLDCPHVELVLN